MPECCKIVSMLSLHSENGQKCNPSDVNVCSQWHFKAVSLLYDVCKAPNNADTQIHTTQRCNKLTQNLEAVLQN